MRRSTASTSSRTAGSSTFASTRRARTRSKPLGLVEEAALEDAGLLLGRHLDVLGREQEDALRDPLHATAERVGHARGEVDQPLGELAVRRLEVDDHRLRALELV